MHNMETCLSVWEHHSTLCEYIRFYKHCSCDVTSDVRKRHCLRLGSGLPNYRHLDRMIAFWWWRSPRGGGGGGGWEGGKFPGGGGGGGKISTLRHWVCLLIYHQWSMTYLLKEIFVFCLVAKIHTRTQIPFITYRKQISYIITILFSFLYSALRIVLRMDFYVLFEKISDSM
jgi:hypothetical protein